MCTLSGGAGSTSLVDQHAALSRICIRVKLETGFPLGILVNAVVSLAYIRNTLAFLKRTF